MGESVAARSMKPRFLKSRGFFILVFLLTAAEHILSRSGRDIPDALRQARYTRYAGVIYLTPGVRRDIRLSARGC